MPSSSAVRVGPSTLAGLCGLVARWALRAAAVLAGVLTIHYAVVHGRDLQRTAPEIFLGAAPFVGRNFRDGWDWRWSPALAVAAAVASVLAVALATGRWWRLGTVTSIALSSLAAGAFAVALAATDGRDGLTYGVAHETEYLANLATAPPAAEFVDTFVEQINDYTVHVRGHPPGYVLALKALDAVGLSGVWPVVALSILGAMVTVAAVLCALWAVSGRQYVLRAGPVLAVAPAAIWMVTSADAVFSALAAVTVAALTWGHHRSGLWSVGLGALAGLSYGVLLFSTYGGAVFVLVPVVATVAAWRWRRPGLVPASFGAIGACGLVTAGFAAAGFWWFEGLDTTRFEYWEGTAQFRTPWFFVAVNASVALVVLGPAVVAALLRVPRTPMWVLAGAALACIVASTASQYSKGEVERIWLLFYPWVSVLAGWFIGQDRRVLSIAVIASQAATAIVLQAALVSKW